MWSRAEVRTRRRDRSTRAVDRGAAGMILSATSAQHVESDKEVNPFTDNVEFLEAKSREVMLLLERASLIRKSSLSGGTDGDSTGGNTAPGRVRQQALFQVDLGEHEAATLAAVRGVEKELGQLREENLVRMEASAPDDIPFLALARQFRLDQASQDVIWLLFFKAISPDFHQKFRDFKRSKFESMNLDDMYVGDVLDMLFPGDFRGQLAARRLFSTDSTLVDRHLIEAPYASSNSSSILELEVVLPSRIIQWISGDDNQYAGEQPFLIERPDTQLSQVVLPDSVVEPVLKLVERYDEYVRLRKSVGIDSVVHYGRAVVILEHGPSGTGKTLLARAISNHTGKPLISLPCGPHAEQGPPGYRGNRDRERLSMLFREGQLQNGIVFIDECENTCGKGTPLAREFLLELERSEALVIMTTNQPATLPTALDRRITLKVPFELPSPSLRKKIWELLLPTDVPLADDVDLARNYTFSGGYIKNAVLTALNWALSRSLGRDMLITQSDLEEAARLQERHIGPRLSLRTLCTPRLRLSDCVVSQSELARLELLTKTAQNYREVARRWGWRDRITKTRSRGLKALFYGDGFEAAVEAAEAVAGELGVRVDQIQLHEVVKVHEISTGRHRHSDKEYDVFLLGDIFSLSAESGHLMVLLDEWDVLKHVNGGPAYDTLFSLFNKLAAFDGTVIVVSAWANAKLPKWAEAFHEKVRFGKPDIRARAVYWRRALNSSIPLARSVKPEKLAGLYDLGFDEIQSAVYKACLIKAAEDPHGKLDAGTIKHAVESLRRDERGPLFG